MDFSKLSANEKLAVYGSVALVVLGIVSNWGGLLWLSVLAGIGALVVIFLPQMSPTTTLPGTKGTLLVTLGGIAAAGAVIELLRFISYFFNTLNDWQTWAFAIALIGAVVLAWAGWQIFQGEGGKFQFGMAESGAAAASPPPAAPPPAEPMAPSEPMTPSQPPPSEPMAPSSDMGGGMTGQTGTTGQTEDDDQA